MVCPSSLRKAMARRMIWCVNLNGWQIAPDDYDALVNTMRLALSDLRHLRTMGVELYRIVHEEINLEKMVAVFVQALNSLMSIVN